MKCSKCNQENTMEAVFCCHCGNKFQKAKKDKKWIILIAVVLTFVILITLSGCGNAAKITKLENENSNIEEKISAYEDELQYWENIYYEAQNTYNSYKHSEDYAIQMELERTKEIMDEANNQIYTIKRQIYLLETSKRINDEQIDRLNED